MYRKIRFKNEILMILLAVILFRFQCPIAIYCHKLGLDSIFLSTYTEIHIES